jgi:hypothetical protein
MGRSKIIKKPLIYQVGSAVSLCRFCSHWLRTVSILSIVLEKSSPKLGLFFFHGPINHNTSDLVPYSYFLVCRTRKCSDKSTYLWTEGPVWVAEFVPALDLGRP